MEIHAKLNLYSYRPSNRNVDVTNWGIWLVSDFGTMCGNIVIKKRIDI